jgi:predicted metalloprotease
VILCTAAVASGCARRVSGTPTAARVPDAQLQVRGDSGGAFDTEVKNALSDVMAFWEQAYPTIADGKALPPLKGALYSVDGLAVLRTRTLPEAARGDACLTKSKLFIVDNAAYCELDDSILWDRSPQHLLPLLADKYGSALTALVFAHEFGHAIQKRVDVPAGTPTIDLESQADCAAGAFVAEAMKGRAPHFHLTPAQVDTALEGFLQIRDSTPESPEDISHGNGFDRLSALQQGITNGVRYCYGSSYFANRTFTERGYTDSDILTGGNESLSDLLGPAGGLVADLNRFWTQAGTTVKHTFAKVKLAAADHPPCAASATTQFGYCTDTNTVYYSNQFAHDAYYSLSALDVDQDTGNISVKHNQPADFALGTMLAIAWGMAARHQFFDKPIDDADGLSSAICYAGAYAENVNNPTGPVQKFALSPPDLDEATSAVLSLVGLDTAFGVRGTTGLERVSSFVTGFDKGLHSC